MGKEEEKRKMESIPEADDDYLFYRFKKDRDSKSMIWKVPGEVVPVGKMHHEKRRDEDELRQKSVTELEEMLARQCRVLDNPRLVARLPDKGAKTRERREQLERAIAEKMKEDDLVEKMEGLGIGKLIDTDAMEWAKRGGGEAHQLDSDDDPDPEDDQHVANPLKLLASRELPYRHQKTDKIRHDSIEPFAADAAAKVDDKESSARFQPFNSATDHVSAGAGLGVPPPKPAGAAVATAATPRSRSRTDPIPLPRVYNCRTKLMSLQESLALQQQQTERLRETQRRHAAEMLAFRVNTGPVTAEVKDASEYRDTAADYNTDDEDGGEGDDEGGGVNVQVDSLENQTEED